MAQSEQEVKIVWQNEGMQQVVREIEDLWRAIGGSASTAGARTPGGAGGLPGMVQAVGEYSPPPQQAHPVGHLKNDVLANLRPWEADANALSLQPLGNVGVSGAGMGSVSAMTMNVMAGTVNLVATNVAMGTGALTTTGGAGGTVGGVPSLPGRVPEGGSIDGAMALREAGEKERQRQQPDLGVAGPIASALGIDPTRMAGALRGMGISPAALGWGAAAMAGLGMVSDIESLQAQQRRIQPEEYMGIAAGAVEWVPVLGPMAARPLREYVQSEQDVRLTERRLRLAAGLGRPEYLEGGMFAYGSRRLARAFDWMQMKAGGEPGWFPRESYEYQFGAAGSGLSPKEYLMGAEEIEATIPGASRPGSVGAAVARDISDAAQDTKLSQRLIGAVAQTFARPEYYGVQTLFQQRGLGKIGGNAAWEEIEKAARAAALQGDLDRARALAQVADLLGGNDVTGDITKLYKGHEELQTTGRIGGTEAQAATSQAEAMRQVGFPLTEVATQMGRALPGAQQAVDSAQKLLEYWQNELKNHPDDPAIQLYTAQASAKVNQAWQAYGGLQTSKIQTDIQAVSLPGEIGYSYGQTMMEYAERRGEYVTDEMGGFILGGIRQQRRAARMRAIVPGLSEEEHRRGWLEEQRLGQEELQTPISLAQSQAGFGINIAGYEMGGFEAQLRREQIGGAPVTGRTDELLQKIVDKFDEQIAEYRKLAATRGIGPVLREQYLGLAEQGETEREQTIIAGEREAAFRWRPVTQARLGRVRAMVGREGGAGILTQEEYGQTLSAEDPGMVRNIQNQQDYLDRLRRRGYGPGTAEYDESQEILRGMQEELGYAREYGRPRGRYEYRQREIGAIGAVATGEMGLAIARGEGGVGAIPAYGRAVGQAVESERESLTWFQRQRPGTPAAAEAQADWLTHQQATLATRSGIADMPLSAPVLGDISRAGFEAEVLTSTPSASGDVRGIARRGMAATRAAQAELQRMYNARRAAGTMKAADEFAFQQRFQDLARQGLQFYHQMEYGWQDRMVSMVANAPGNFSMIAPMASMMEATHRGIRNPAYGGTQEQMQGFLHEGGDVVRSLMGHTNTPMGFAETALGGGTAIEGPLRLPAGLTAGPSGSSLMGMESGGGGGEVTHKLEIRVVVEDAHGKELAEEAATKVLNVLANGGADWFINPTRRKK